MLGYSNLQPLKAFETSYSMSHLVILNLGKGDWQQGFSMAVAQLWMSNGITILIVTNSLLY